MKRFVFTLALILVPTAVLSSQEQENLVVNRLPSPDHKYTATYKGTDYGFGAVYITGKKVQIPLFNTDSNHIPSFKWLSQKTLSIRVHCGSPCWYERYYNTDTKALSQEFEFTLARNHVSQLVVHVGPEDEILVSEMFSGNVRLRYTPTQEKCQEFVFLYLVKFVDPMTISVKCSNESVILHIPSHATSK